MLSLIGDSFALGTAQVGQVAMLTQVGYAAGLLFVPLGDRLVRGTRRMTSGRQKQ